MTSSVLESFNNREIALCVWIILILSLSVGARRTRKTLLGILKALFHWQMMRTFLFLFAYIYVTLQLLRVIDIWNIALRKDFIFWFMGVGLVSFLKVNNAIRNPQHFRDIVLNNVKLTIYVEFIINLYVFSLPVELFLSLLIILFGLITVVGERDKKNTSVVNFSKRILNVIGLVISVYVIAQVAGDSSHFTTLDNLRSFLFPVVMTLAFLPFLYCLAIWMHYQNYFVRLGFAFKNNSELLKYAKRRIFQKALLNQNKLREIDKELSIFRIDSREQLDEALKVI